MARILFVEDEMEVLSTLKAERQGHCSGARTGKTRSRLYVPARCGGAGRDAQEGPGPDGMNGFDICSALRDQGFHRPILFLTCTSEGTNCWVRRWRGQLRDQALVAAGLGEADRGHAEAGGRRPIPVPLRRHQGGVGPNDMAIHHPMG